MQRFGAAVILALAGVLPALADEMPSRKAGLWEVKTNFESRGGSGLSIQQCVDAQTDQMMMSSAGPLAQSVCPKRDVHRSGDGVTIDSTCSFNDKAAKAHTVITGSLDSAYTMTVTTQGDAIPGGKMAMTMTGKWLGPCTADQKPGDLIMPGGLKLNILEMQKRGPSQGIPLPK